MCDYLNNTNLLLLVFIIALCLYVIMMFIYFFKLCRHLARTISRRDPSSQGIITVKWCKSKIFKEKIKLRWWKYVIYQFVLQKIQEFNLISLCLIFKWEDVRIFWDMYASEDINWSFVKDKSPKSWTCNLFFSTATLSMPPHDFQRNVFPFPQMLHDI